MSRSGRFFRGLWRVNAVVIFLAAALITIGVILVLYQEFGRKLTASASPIGSVAVSDSNDDEKLQFDNASIVPGSGVITVDLVAKREGTGPSSGTTSVTRNILFVEPDQQAAHWLLPDNAHVLSHSSPIYDKPASDAAQMIGTAVIVRTTQAPDDSAGRLLVFNRAGRNIVEVSNSATSIELAGLAGSEVALLYRNGTRLVRATLNPATLVKRGEMEITVPVMK